MKQQKKVPMKKTAGKRLNELEIIELKTKIYELSIMGGMSNLEIGRNLGYNKETINRYAKEVYADAVKDFESHFDREKTLTRIIFRKEDNVKRLKYLAISSSDEKTKISALKTSDDIDNNIIKIMQDIGVIQRNIGVIETKDTTVKVYDTELIKDYLRKEE